MRIDRADDDDCERPDATDAPTPGEADAARHLGLDQSTATERQDDEKDVSGHSAEAGAAQGDEAGAARVARNLEYRATVEGVYQANTIDQGYARVKEMEEKTVTPAMRRIETEDPDRYLAGLERRLKGKDRLTEKVSLDVEKKGRSVDQAFANVKDAIRYTFVYGEDKYTAGVRADCERLENAVSDASTGEIPGTKTSTKGSTADGVFPARIGCSRFNSTLKPASTRRKRPIGHTNGSAPPPTTRKSLNSMRTSVP